MALVSIGHRVSGFFLFLCLPWAIFMLSQAVSTPVQFQALTICLSHPLVKMVNWLLLVACAYHVIAGARHLMMDMGWGESLSVARATAILVLFLLVVVMVLAGVWIW